MDLNELMRGNEAQLTTLPLSRVQKSDLNFYDQANTEEEIEAHRAKVIALKEDFKINGQITPIEVIRNRKTKMFTVLSGNTRLEAMQLLNEELPEDAEPFEIKALVLKTDFADMSEDAMEGRIVSANLQRHKTDTDRLNEIRVIEKEFEKRKAAGEVGGEKAEYISTRMGISKRTYYYLKSDEAKAEEAAAESAPADDGIIPDLEVPEDVKEEKELELKDLYKKIRSVRKAAEKACNLALELGETAVHEILSDPLAVFEDLENDLKDRV